MKFGEAKKYIDEKKLKDMLIEYMNKQSPKSEFYLFGEALPELSRRIMYTFSIKDSHSNFDDLLQTINIKLYTVITDNRIDTDRGHHAIFCYIYTIIRFAIIANMNKYYKYIDHFKFFDDSENKNNDAITMEQNEWTKL